MKRLTCKMPMVRVCTLIIATVLALAATAPVFAQEDGELERQGLSGVVTLIGEDSITVETADGESVTIATTDDTQVRLPSKNVQNVLEVELEEGSRVAVLAELETDGSLIALWILVKPERPQFEHLLGAIISLEGNLITIVDDRGNEHTVELPEQARRGLEVGDIATLIVDQSDDNDEEPDNPVAHAAVTAAQIQERAREHAGELWRRAQSGEIPVAMAEERIQFLTEIMDSIKAHLHGVLTAVLDKVPSQAQAAIEQARERVGMGFDSAKEAIQSTGPPEDAGPTEGAGPPEGAGRP